MASTHRHCRFKVIFPAIVQLIIDKQKMPIIGGAFQVVSPSQLNVSLATSLNTPIEAKVKPMTLFLYNRETPEFSPFVNLSFPAIKVKGKTILGLTNETRPILNETELANWFSDVFDAKETALSARGDMKASSGALHFSAKLKKTIKIPGLNKLHGFGIIDMQLVLPPKDDGTNVKGTVNMPNWSVVTLGFGDLALNVLSGDTDKKIGLINVPNVVIPPGNHSFAFTGQIYIKEVLEDISAILESQAEALSKGNLKISATGNSTTVNGEHIPFAEKVLNNKRLESEVSVITLVSQIFGGLLTEGADGGPGLLHLIGDVVGNKTLVEEVLETFNSSGILDNMSSKGKETRSVVEGKPSLPIMMELVKMGIKMNSFRT